MNVAEYKQEDQGVAVAGFPLEKTRKSTTGGNAGLGSFEDLMKSARG
jgi:hypothetical protein